MDFEAVGRLLTPARPAAPEPSTTTLIDVRRLEKIFITVRGERIHALSNISLTVREREFVTVVGPSGCGKTTLLKILAGLTSASAGSVQVAGKAVAAPRRDIGIVFQNPILLPWRTVLDNVVLPAEVQGMSLGGARIRARKLLDMVGLSEFENKYPMELSGGMQQRAAISRALVHDPSLLLMDEPFGALDAMTREQMNLDLQRIWQESGKTVLLITHSIPEAVFLGDRVAVMTRRPGRIARIVDVPIARPRSLDVMGEPLFARLTGEIRKILYGHGDTEAGTLPAGGPT